MVVCFAVIVQFDLRVWLGLDSRDCSIGSRAYSLEATCKQLICRLCHRST